MTILSSKVEVHKALLRMDGIYQSFLIDRICWNSTFSSQVCYLAEIILHVHRPCTKSFVKA